MPKIIFAFIFTIFAIQSFAQNDLITVKLDKLGRDERFEKMVLTMPVFLTLSDSVLTMDFENLKPAKKIQIIRPLGYNSYGYGYVFFSGNNNVQNQGYSNLLFAGVYDVTPRLFVDRNNNFDFTDDGDGYVLPRSKDDSLLFTLYRNDDSLAGIAIKLKLLNFGNQPAYRKLMNEYYQYFYKDRTLAGIEHCYREQRYIIKCGTVKLNNDSFRLALYDGNSNGLYNEPDSDRVITANMDDTIFDSRDELRAFPVSQKKMYVEYHGEQFEIIEIDRAGRFIKLKHLSENLLLGKTKIGEKIQKFKFTTWNGEKKKIKKFKKFEVYLYFTGSKVKDFSNDTSLLREIADAYPDRLKVITFIDVNKSYELKIFGTYSNLNYIAAFKEREIIQKLAIKGLPASIWLGKKRKVIAYNLKPQDFLKAFKTRQLNNN
ncbi:MAG: hypothetical protein WCO28_00795 [Bacteroidota bacterium]